MTNDIRAIDRGAEGYPSAFEDLPDAPARVWVRGELGTAPCVAIVGTRRASPEALAFTEHVARELARGGATIVSGGADGIDAAAHSGAVLAGGRTVVIQAAGLERPYPPRNAALFARILESGGGWLSETPPSGRPERYKFLARNRLIAALADAVVIVQAPARSGALSTARFAQALGRPLFAVPGAPWDPRAEGALALLAHGATLFRRSSDVASIVGVPQVQLTLRAPDVEAARSDAQDRVMTALSDGPRHVDEIVARAELSAARVQVALVELSIAGLVRQSAGRWHAI